LQIVIAVHRQGIIELDDSTFDKVIDGRHHALVLFQEQSWKEPAKFEDVGKEFITAKDIIIAKVDGASADELKKRLNIDKLPSIKFFPKGSTTPEITYEGDDSAEALIEFVRSRVNSNFKRLREIATSFSKSNQKGALVKEIESIHSTLSGTDAELANYYLKTAQQTVKRGDEFTTEEAKRLAGLINNKATTQQKKNEFNRRLNIIKQFL